MVTILMVVSISLNLIAFLAIINLYVRQNRLKDVEKKQAKIVEDMEQSIAAFIIQMHEDNEEFINKVKDVYTIKGNLTLTKELEKVELKEEKKLQVNEETNSKVLSPLKYMAVKK